MQVGRLKRSYSERECGPATNLPFPFINHRTNDDESPEAPEMVQSNNIEVHQENTGGFFAESSGYDNIANNLANQSNHRDGKPGASSESPNLEPNSDGQVEPAYLGKERRNRPIKRKFAEKVPKEEMLMNVESMKGRKSTKQEVVAGVRPIHALTKVMSKLKENLIGELRGN